MASKVLSIDVGYTNTHICMTDYKVKSPKVYKHVKIATPQGVLVDGALNVTDEYVTELKQAIAKNKMNCKNVVFHVTSTKVASREVNVPVVKDNRLLSMVQANASDYFPIDLSQYKLGYIKLGIVNEGAGDRIRLMVLAMPASMIDGYSELASKCGLNMVALDYCGNSIYQVVKEHCKEGVQMVIKIDNHSSLLTVMKNQVMVLQRNIGYGISDAVETIVENKVFGCETYQEAVALAERKTCTKLAINAEFLDEEDEEADSIEMAAAKQKVANTLNMLVGGIGRVIDYYSSRNGGEQIDQIYITGVGSEFSGLSKLLTNELGTKIKNLRHIDNMSLEKSFADGHFGSYIGCIGAVVAPVPFIDESGKKGKGKKEAAGSKDNTAAAYLLLLGGIIIGAALVVTSGLAYMEEANAYAENVRTLNSLTEIKSVYAKYVLTDSTHKDVEALYGITENSNDGLLLFIEEMEKKMPADIQVTSFVSDTQVVNMNIEVGTKEEMANAVQQLRGFKSLSDVKVMGSQDETDENGIRTVTFSVNCVYKTQAELAAEEAAAAAN